MKTFKRILTSIIVVVMMLTGVPLNGFVVLELPEWLDFSILSRAAETSGACGENLTWTFNDTIGKLTISGTGKMEDFNTLANISPWYSKRNSIKSVVIESKVTSIGSQAFFGCTSLSSVSIPNSVTMIGESSFYSCTSLSSVSIPDSVTVIDSGAFFGCTNLANIAIPDSVISIGSSVFKDTAYYNDESNWEKGVLYVGNHIVGTNSEKVSGVYKLKSGILSIADCAFQNCTSLKTVLVPSSVKRIGDYAFSGCSILWLAEIQSNLETIPNGIFEGCSKLSSVTLSGSCKIIGSSAFKNCAALEKVNLPDGLISIESYAFQGCTTLCNLTIPESVNSIAKEAFVNTGMYNDASNWYGDVFYIDDCLIVASENFSGSHSVKKGTRLIAANAFYSKKITSIDFPDSLNIIGDMAFYMCSSLTGDLIIPANVETIGGYAFYCTQIQHLEYNASVLYGFRGCRSLTTVILGETVTRLSSLAYTGIEELYIPANVKEIDKDAFLSCLSLTEINVANGNANYSSKDGVLFNKNKTSLVYYPAGKLNTEYTIPKTVTRIEPYGFDCAQYLTTLRMPNSISYIGEYAFDVSDKLGLDDFESIYYCGTKEQMAEIELNSTERIDESTIYYNAHITQDGSEQTVHPTCTEAGKTKKTTVCTICGNTVAVDITTLPALGHQEGEWKVVYKASCLTYGKKELRCVRVDSLGKVCNAVIETKEIDGRLHNWDSGEITENPSCLEQGMIIYCCQNTNETEEYEACDDRKSSFIEPIGHKWDNGVVTTASTCATQGTKTYTCQNNTSHKKTEKLALNPSNHAGGTTIKNAKSATCTADGYSGDTYCAGCNTKLKSGTTIAKLGHDWGNWTVVKSATCEADGQEKHVCKRDSSHVETRTVSMTGHKWDNGVVTTASTCTTQGIKTYTCQNDTSHKKTEILALNPSNHAGRTIIKNVKSATCTADGYSGDAYCADCNTMLVKGERIPATDHTIVIDYAISPTCTQSGLTEGSHCSVCNKVIKAQVVLPPNEHKGTPVTTEATCETPGKTVVSCKNCGMIFSETVIAPKGHVEGEIVIENFVEPDCKNEGSYDEVLYCTVCEKELSRRIVSVDACHKEEIIPAVQPTCEKTGLTEGKKCSACGEILIEQKTVEALGHKEAPAAEENKIDAECEKTGSRDIVVYCSVCEKELSRTTEVIEAYGHVIVKDDEVKPGCTTTGLTEGSHCSVCGVVLVEQTRIPATGHIWGEWIIIDEPTETETGLLRRYCDVCKTAYQDQIIPMKGQEYSLSGTVTSFYSDTDEILITLTKRGQTEPSYSTVLIGNFAEYKFPHVEIGYYTLTVTKKNHVTRTYDIAMGNIDEFLDIKIHLPGDTIGDGRINTVDVAIVNSHAKGVKTLDGYQFACADVNGDGKINTVDVALINAHAKGISLLW